MVKPILSLLFIIVTIAVFGQQRVPVFANKKDSADYANINQKMMDAMRNPGNASRIDSLGKTIMMIREKAIRYLTEYGPSFRYVNYTKRPDDLKSITQLTLVNYKGKTLPDSILLMTNLTDLELVNTRIKRLPAKLSDLKSLKRVTVLNNRPRGRMKLSRNSSLETIVIHDDEFDHRPRHYRKVSSLKVLDLGRCNLTQFPNIKGNQALRRLVLNDNKISLLDLKKELPALEDLVLTANDIQHVPSSINRFSGLKKLNLSANRIEGIAPEISTLQNLEQLLLYKNKLKSLPPQVYGLKNLKVIDLYYNDLEQLDPAMSQWTNLEILYAANNRLFSLPDNVGSFKQLRELYLHHNRLSTLPESLGTLDSLRVLRVNNNLLLELPNSFYALKALENLDISSNQIQGLPAALFAFPRLKILSLKNNPLDPATRASVLLWARQAMEQRNVMVHLEGAETPDTR